ncbi:unnamed protein product [Hermetia illucens]|uniref:Peptidase S1 domain-containing protein n=1 Tax=Hermetia illucens TaxID=343691 RepID=A0A7R8UIU8_HERIL|nr:chymotrypsin-2-like [Hermetia illucens]CAD7081454.1 unnamed protein product [Hermetia illucens]
MRKFVIFLCIPLVFAEYLDKVFPPQNFERVVGGKDAPEGSAPFQISLQTSKGQHMCGGAIIGKEWIITAGHCVSGRTPESLKVLTGTQDLKGQGVYYFPKKIYVHEKYNKPAYHNDIALIRLNDSIRYNEFTQKISFSPNDSPDDAVITLTGWGRLSAGGSIPTELQAIELKRMAYVDCKRKFSDDPNLGVGHLCTYNQAGQGACNGDSGGPLTHEGLLVALVNWGIPCAKGFPDVHARVSYYHDWIKTTTGSGEQ